MEYTINGKTLSFITILENPNKATYFKHFKNKLYKIFTIAKDSETLEDIVVYQKQYDDFSFYTRTATMFFSDVDKKKYPNVFQKERFMLINSQ